jgi:dCMP deaminase
MTITNIIKDKFLSAYMDVAERFSQLSSAKRLQVGAIVVKDDRIISIGYNGMPSGWDNTCENVDWMSIDAGGWLDPEEIESQWPFEGIYTDSNGGERRRRYRLVTKPEVLHAEMNALMKLAKSNESGDNAAIFITHSPCLECAKGIHIAGIKEVYYKHEYRSTAGTDFLKKCGILVQQL